MTLSPEGRRLCQCGCGADISHRGVQAKYLDGTHRERAYRQRGGEFQRPAAEAGQQGESDPDLPPDISLTKARIALEDLAIKQIQREREDLELKKLQGELVPFAEVESEAKTAWIAYRTKMLGIPTKFRTRHPSLSLEVIDDLEGICHEMLTELVKEQSEPDVDDEDSESP